MTNCNARLCALAMQQQRLYGYSRGLLVIAFFIQFEFFT